MATYRFEFFEEHSGYIYFDADNIEEARELFEQVQEGDLFPEDLPNYDRNTKSGQDDYDNLEESN